MAFALRAAQCEITHRLYPHFKLKQAPQAELAQSPY